MCLPASTPLRISLGTEFPVFQVGVHLPCRGGSVARVTGLYFDVSFLGRLRRFEENRVLDTNFADVMQGVTDSGQSNKSR